MKSKHVLTLLLLFIASTSEAQITATHYSICVGTTLALSDPSLGGGWTSDNPSVATVDMITGQLFGVSPGTATIHYLGDTKIFTIIGFNVLSPASACVGDTITLYMNPSIVMDRDFNPNNDYTGYFSSIGAPDYWDTVMSGSTFLIKPYWLHPDGIDNTIVLTDTVSDTGNVFSSGWNTSGLATCEVQPVRFNTNPATIVGLSNVCAGDSITLSDATIGGSWTSSNTGIATVASTGVVTGIAHGTATVSYTVSNVCGSASATKVVTVSAALETPITGTSAVCAGSSVSLSNTTTGGTWNSSNIHIAVTNATGIVTGIAAGTATISYTVTNSCGTVTTTKVLTVNEISAGIPTLGLMAWYPFNGNTNDESGNGNNGTNFGASLTFDRRGQADKAFIFNGINSFISIGNLNDYDFYSSNFTISAWYYNVDSTTTLQRAIIGKDSACTTIPGQFRLTLRETGAYYPNNIVLAADGSGNRDTVAANANRWINVIIVKDSLYNYLYIDGVLKSTGMNDTTIHSGSRNWNCFLGARYCTAACPGSTFTSYGGIFH